MPEPSCIPAVRHWHGVAVALILTSVTSFSCSPNVAQLIGFGGGPSAGLMQEASNLEVFDTAWKLVENRYYDPGIRAIDWEGLRDTYRKQADTASSEQSLYAILGSMMSVLEDGHTRVESPASVWRAEGNVDVGLGVRGKWIDDQFVIMEVSPYSPAALAGVKPGWILSKWEEFPFGQFVERNAQYLIREGQTVKLEFLDAEDNVNRVRVTGRFYPRTDPRIVNRIQGGIVYIRFDHFSDDSAEWFSEELARHHDAPGVIVDLRNNRGGQLSALRRILSNFYKRDYTLGEEIHRDGDSRAIRVSGHGRRAYRGGVIVLTDRSSQSAAEVFAATIQESGRGAVVGRTTAGNVLVSHRKPLPDGGELRISTRDFVTAGGRRLEGRGVSPNVFIEPDLESLRHRVDEDVHTAISLLGYMDDAVAEKG